ncbi:CKLF-like MARVEL transmembrane domain-containing protein 4 [Panulirus ornatus]|uniref:CKLF-like MARVEL transmembrane domain-containing protein 4 n=1 Tax=Panulirus ornatus TaxID=150431 RepID=UPI003A85C8E9
MTGLFCTGTLLVLYVMHVIERLQRVPWLMGEFGYCALWTFFYLTASAGSAAWGAMDGFNAVAAFFGFAAMIAYAVDAFFKFRGWRRGDLAQGERQVEDAGPEMLSPGAY